MEENSARLHILVDDDVHPVSVAAEDEPVYSNLLPRQHLSLVDDTKCMELAHLLVSLETFISEH